MVSGGNEGYKEKKKWADSKVYTRKSLKGLKNSKSLSREQQQKSQEMVSEGLNLTKRLVSSVVDAALDNFSGLNRDGLAAKGGILRPDSRVIINLSMKSKEEVRELRRKLECERNMVWNLIKKIETNEKQKNDHGFNKSSENKVPVGPSCMLKSLNQLSVSVVEDSQGGSENMEIEKRTPRENQFYKNSEFLLAKDKFPSAESNKKLKSNRKKGGVSESGNRFGLGNFSNQALKGCSVLLERLMKHKHGWVFNKPVDTVALGLHDYFEIIKNPMDLGTVKAKLNQNLYKSPIEFAEDVRLTFRNAMTYNLKEQDVYMMAEQLSKIFEDKWASLEADYIHELNLTVDFEAPTPTSTSTSRKVPPQSRPLPDMRRVLDRSESMTHPIDPQQRSAQSGRTATAKKPKAKDPNKREMTFEEKQKLSINLQSLPSEKLENVVQIIKRRNPSLSQCDDEIEVDIDIVDAETLWELDRFIANYKKSLSKNKRKAEIAIQLKDGDQQNPQETIPSPVVTVTPKEFEESKTDENNGFLPLAQVEKLGGNDAGKPSNASGSSPDSGSSSSDSDSESTSGSGSDAGHSPNN